MTTRHCDSTFNILRPNRFGNLARKVLRCINFCFQIKDFCSCDCSLTSIPIILSGDALILGWKSKDRKCEIEFKEINVELAITSVDKDREEFPLYDDASSEALPITNMVRWAWPWSRQPKSSWLDNLNCIHCPCIYSSLSLSDESLCMSIWLHV